jgi:nanoRNase/pAp phosphatase (c-di-AMP/oligoRNAs hydrolase)
MKDLNDFTPVEEALASAQTLAIVLPTSLNVDKVAAALSLYLSLKKAGKQVSIICALPMTVEYSSLVGVDKISKKIAGRNLLIAFPYQEDSIEKVSYHIENNKFNLIIQPKDGFPPLPIDKIEYSYFGSQSDVVLVVGGHSWENLGEVYFTNKTIFEQAKTINLDINPRNQQFAKINFVNPQMASLSEMVTLLLTSLNLPLDEDIASNLLLGLKKATFDFSLGRATAATFEAVAICLKAGGRRPLHEKQERRFEEKRMPSPQINQPSEEVRPPKPQPDWYKPKIYKGDTKV